MSDFSGIRATARRNRDGSDRTSTKRLALVGAALLAATLAPLVDARPAGANDPHAAPPDHAAAPPAATPAPPPPPASQAQRPPPPRLDGPIAAPVPRPRLDWIADPITGRALGGYDPVAYFLYDRPTPGEPDRQYDWGGTTWLFADEGTLAAFRDAPEVYAPLFGGRDAFAVSQGRPAEGSPQHFVIHGGRLLLFADAASRAAFLLDADRLLAEARRRWPALLADLP